VRLPRIQPPVFALLNGAAVPPPESTVDVDAVPEPQRGTAMAAPETAIRKPPR
jgi:hypothetical protein